MKRTGIGAGIVSALLLGFAPIAQAQTAVLQQHSNGTIARGSTVCVGPVAPSDSIGVQIAGFTNGTYKLTWQILTVSSQSAPAVIWQTTARNVDHTEAPRGNLLFVACVLKTANAAQDYDIALNSSPIE